MKPKEIVECIEKNNPELLQQIPKGAASRLVQAAMQELARQGDAAEPGVLKVPGFGRFRVRLVEKEKDGRKVTVKAIRFFPGGTGDSA